MNHASLPELRALREGNPLVDGGRFLLGDWMIDVAAHRIVRGDDVIALEPRPMAVLAELCRRCGDVVTADALLDACWPGQVQGDNQVHKVIAGLRRALQDAASSPRYIETIRKQGYRLIAPIRVLSDEGPRSLCGAWRGASPFRGLEPFGTEHAAVYFGRDDAVRQLHRRLAEQQARGHGLVVLLGPSGSGKTSLVRAGLIPAMLAGSAPGDARVRACTATVLDLGALDETGPWQALAGALLDWEVANVALLSGHSIASLTALLRAEPDEVLRLLRIGLQARHAGSQGLPLLVLDRLEGLFGAAMDAGRQDFLDCIEALVRSSLALVLAVCRNDFYPSLSCHRLLMHDKEHGAHMDLAPPDAQAIMQMIRLPARAANLTYGSDASSLNRLDDRLCTDAMQAGDALPLLQYTLQALYLARAPGDELTWAAYDALGGLEGAIGSRAEAILAALPGVQQAALTRLLPRLVTLSAEDASPSSRSVTGASLTDAHERALVDALIDARLLVADRLGGGEIGFRVAHEALLRQWPRVTAWIAQHRVTLTARAELGPWVRRWLDSGRARACLLPRVPLLWQARGAVRAAPQLFGPDEHDFVARSQARLTALARWRVAALVGTLALAVTAGLAAVHNAQLADTVTARERQSRRLATFMLGELADQLRPIGKLDLLGSIAEHGLQVLNPQDVRDELPADTLQRAKALVVIGEVNSSRGTQQLAMAGTALARAQALLTTMGPAPGLDIGEYYKTLGASAFWLGQIAYDAGRLDEATEQMTRYRAASQDWLSAAPAHPQARAELGYALGSLSSIAMRRGRWHDAQRGFEASLALKLAVLADHPDDIDAQDAIASARAWLGQLAHLKGDSLRALALYDTARGVQQQLQQVRPREAVRLRDLGVIESRRAEALQALGRSFDAIAARQAAARWMRQALSAGATNAFWQAESLLADSALLLAQADAGVVIDADLATLQRRLASDGKGKEDVREWRQSVIQTRLAVAGQAMRARDWGAARAAASSAAQDIGSLIVQYPYLWQGRELQARGAMLLLQADAGTSNGTYPPVLCRATLSALQPAIDTGQAGFVREAWLVARACAGEGAITGADVQTLTQGGYRPQAPAFLHAVSTRIAP
ncbi:winged helix-turn-helix domain-containing protein [Massilia sp. MP_M2]|uniref:nSTAND1 domain-containing NTPase n=1 Tax=Massilia sp. MP_M2 TaxID=3071713 RepID=UPI00319E8739